MGVTIPLMQVLFGQIRMEVDASWHASVLQRLPATPYDSSAAGDGRRPAFKIASVARRTCWIARSGGCTSPNQCW
jgi:hypothetical protein